VLLNFDFGEVAAGKAAASLLAVVVQTIRGFESLPSPPNFLASMINTNTYSYEQRDGRSQ
jgi:hypothetical protein